MLGELSGLCGGGEVSGEGIGLPTPSLMAWRAFNELLEKVVPPPELPGCVERKECGSLVLGFLQRSLLVWAVTGVPSHREKR
ncbi:hypothetical protein EYF80_033374 [Liparis tanakae]|uniref:Uncharacterized protein n=1 Tax=Liparis tanakae TaxID=230148 RepID=A0A4Z2GUJ0_9TELE|nr:hypothetical protein EYF80_033374 [Liparis tanakae]